MTIERSEPASCKHQTAMLRYVVTSPEVGQLTPVASGVYLLRMPMDLGLDHINVYLLEDTDGWYVVDTGLASNAVQTIWRGIFDSNLGGKPLKGLICTHFHYDHASLARWMMETFDIPLYMSSGEYLWMRTLADSRQQRVSHDLTPFYHQQGVPQPVIDGILSVVEHDPLSSLYPSHYQRIRDGETFVIGERTWTVLIGEGHSPEHVCLYTPSDGLLIAGDQLLPEISSSIFVNEIEPCANPLRGWLASLDKLATLPVDTTVLPAHGGVFVGLHSRTEAIHSLHQKRLQRLREALDELNQANLYQLMRALFPREMNAMNTMLALGETAAHVNYLINEKEIEKQLSTDSGEIIYRPSIAY